jgi:hypothetical protein
MGSSVLSEVDDTSILRTGLSTRYCRSLNWLPASRLLLPRSGLERSDFVPWPQATEKDLHSNVGYAVLSGLVLLIMSFVGRDPKRKSQGTSSARTKEYTFSAPIEPMDIGAIVSSTSEA